MSTEADTAPSYVLAGAALPGQGTACAHTECMLSPEFAMRTPANHSPNDSHAGIDRSEDANAQLPEGDDINQHLSAEEDVADSLEDMSAHPFDDIPQDGPLNFDDGTDMGHPRGNTGRTDGTWEAEGADSGALKPPSEILSDRVGPSNPGSK